MMMWKDLGTALALLLVIEGILPFLNPSGLRETLVKIIEMKNGDLRMLGAFFMGLGLLLLYMVH